MRRGLSRRMVALICSSLGVASLSFSGNALASSSERSRAVAVGGTWGDAQEVPGTSRLNTGVEAAVEALSCGSPGNCAAGGYYADKAGQVHGFLDVELNGTWRAAQQVPGLAAIGQGSSEITAISCGGQGNCMAVGWTYTRSNQIPSLAFAVSYSNGRWHDAVAIRGSITFGGPSAGDLSISCPSAGNCAVGGSYRDRAGHAQAFVVREVSGAWRRAIAVPGTASLNKGGYAQANSVSCASPRNCAVVGYYLDSAHVARAFVDDLVRGVWHAARQAPGTAASHLGANLTAIACASPSNCTAGGSIGSTFRGPAQALVASEVNGTWRPAVVVPGIIRLNSLKMAAVSTVSCASPGNCSAGGSYYTTSYTYQAFVVDQVNGVWRTAIEVPGTATLNAGGAFVAAVSCTSPGNCSAGGDYQYPSGHDQAFVVSEVNGIWGKAIEVPGAAALGTQADIRAVSCAAPGRCAAGGDFSKAVVGVQAMVVNEH